MKKFFYLTIFLITLNGCASSTTEIKVNKNAPANTTTVSNSEMTNSEIVANANQLSIRGTTINKDTRNAMLAGKGQGNTPPEPIIPTAKQTPHSAPDDSEITSMMDAKGQMIETRIFKKNAALAKMEINVTDAENPQIKIYLRNGKVLNAPSNKIINPQSASADEILSAVGLATNAAPEKSAQSNKPKTDN